MANCLRLPLSITVHLPEWHNILKEYLSFIPDRSHFQGLRACAPFPVALLMPISVEWDASCLTSLSSNSRLLGLWFQHWSSWVMPLPGWWLKSSAYVTANSKIGIRWLTMSFICSASSPTSSHDSPAASSNLTKWACLLSSLCIARAATGTSCHFDSATVPVTGIGVAPVPIILPSHPEAFVFFPLKGTEQYWTWLSRPGPGHGMLLWVLSLELPGLQHSFSKYLTSLSRFCTCSRLKFQSTGHVHCARHLPILWPTPCHHCPASGQSPGWHSEIILDL